MENHDFIALLVKRYPVLSPVEEEIRKACGLMITCYEGGGKVLAGGNGGSCADSEHIVGELMKSFCKKRRIPDADAKAFCAVDPGRGKELAEQLEGALPAIAVTGHDGLTSAFGNDKNWKLSMAQQVYGYGRSGDVFLGISTSGNSENVVNAAVVARAKGMKVVALTGRSGGVLKDFADAAVIVPVQETYQIQELHLPIYHAICLQLEDHFFEA